MPEPTFGGWQSLGRKGIKKQNQCVKHQLTEQANPANQGNMLGDLKAKHFEREPFLEVKPQILHARTKGLE